MNEIKQLKEFLLKQEKQLRKLESTDIKSKIKKLEEYLVLIEKETVYLRYLISTIPNDYRTDKSLTPNDYHYDIKIKSEYIDGQNVFIINLPFLLPNRRTSATYFKHSIAESLRFVLMDYCSKNNILPFKKASVTFISYYAPNTKRKLQHDNDNTEISVILNTLTGFLIPDDSSLCCDLHILSRESDISSFTQILIKNLEDINYERFNEEN